MATLMLLSVGYTQPYAISHTGSPGRQVGSPSSNSTKWSPAIPW